MRGMSVAIIKEGADPDRSINTGRKAPFQFLNSLEAEGGMPLCSQVLNKIRHHFALFYVDCLRKLTLSLLCADDPYWPAI